MRDFKLILLNCAFSSFLISENTHIALSSQNQNNNSYPPAIRNIVAPPLQSGQNAAVVSSPGQTTQFTTAFSGDVTASVTFDSGRFNFIIQNPDFLSMIIANGSSFVLSNNADMGNGSIVCNDANGETTGNGPSFFFYGITDLLNPLVLNTKTCMAIKEQSVDVNLSGQLSGLKDLDLSGYYGNYVINPSASSPDYTNKISALQGVRVTLNADFPNASVFVNKDAQFSGTGQIGSVSFSTIPNRKNGTVIAGDGTPGSSLTAGSWTNDMTAYYVYFDADKKSNSVKVTGNATLQSPYAYMFMTPGTYAPGIYDIVVLQADQLNASGKLTMYKIGRPAVDFTGGTITNPDGTQSLIIKMLVFQPVTIDTSDVPGNSYEYREVTFPNPVSIDTNAPIISGSSVNLVSAKGQPTIYRTAFSGDASSVVNFNEGTFQFTLPSSNFSSSIYAQGSVFIINANADMGNGSITCNDALGGSTGTGPTFTLNNVNLSNPLTINAETTIALPTADTQTTLTGALSGSGNLNIGGSSGKLTLSNAASSSTYTGKISVPNATNFVLEAALPNANLSIGSETMLSGSGQMGAVALSGGFVTAGDGTPGSRLTAGSWSNSGTTYTVSFDSNARSNMVTVTGSATLNNPVVNVLMTQGTYQPGTYDVFVLRSSTLVTSGTMQINAVSHPGITYTGGTTADTNTTTSLIVKAVLSESVTINSDETTSMLAPSPVASVNLPNNLTIGANDVYAPVSAKPIADQIELTSLVFQNHSSSFNQISKENVATSSFVSKFDGQRKLKAGTLEAALNALSEAGTLTLGNNETRIWVMPYVNRVIAQTTATSQGNLGWSGGSLLGIEKRASDDMWSFGILTGAMASRSHVAGNTSTYSSTKGVVLGAFNTYKYSKNEDTGNFSHEILLARMLNAVQSQRYGIVSQTNDTYIQGNPYYATSSYRLTTDVFNGQLNYIFDVIKNDVTCRLDGGVTYTGTHYGNYSEENAGIDGLNQQSYRATSIEYYGGFGLRKTWNLEAKKVVRTTFVYEYGYNAVNSGSQYMTTQASTETNFIGETGKRQNKHYVQVNTSYQDCESGIKTILSCSGVLYGNVQNYTIALKFQYQF